MKKSIFLGCIFSLYCLFIVACSVNTHVKADIIDVNKLVKAEWSNEGSWILLYDPNIQELSESEVAIISLNMSEDKEIFRGKEKAYLIEDYMKLVNEKYYNKVKVSSYKKNEEVLELIYEDGETILWSYKDKKSDLKTK